MTDQKEPNKNSKNLIAGPLAVQAVILLGRLLPRRLGLKLANRIGKLLGKKKNSRMVRAIRANQWVIHKGALLPEDLDQLPVDVFQSAARCLFDYCYFLSRPEELRSIVEFSPQVQMITSRIQQEQPTVIVAPHLSNFDLMGYALALKGLDIQVLSFPNPNVSYQLQNRIRRRVGIGVTPMNLTAFRQARRRLRRGGSILTGLDRPLEGAHREKYRPIFFGHECALPVVYVRMALEADAPVFVMAATSQPGQTYRLTGSDPIWMESSPDLDTEILSNAHRVHSKAEGLIRSHARQWAMFYPIWPQFLGV
jgi:lauroyl/myristoyl acyltransferase